MVQLCEAFVQDWSFATDEDLDGDAWFPSIANAGHAPARVIDSGPDEDLEKIEFAILQSIACARERIAVMTPYFLPDERMMTALSLASMRGVTVDVVVPGSQRPHVRGLGEPRQYRPPAVRRREDLALPPAPSATPR